jgi:CRP/FNR family cyclic AMP-dependent transcriptional regulator
MNSKLEPFREQLDTSHWFSALPPALRVHLLAPAELVRMKSGQVLFRRGDSFCGLYAVIGGALSVGVADAGGRETLLTSVEPVTWFGEIALFDGLPRTHDAIASGNSLLLRVPVAALHRLLEAEPRYWRHLALLLTQKLRMCFINVESLSLLPAAQRLAGRLLMIAEGYGGISVGQSKIKLSQERLALMLSLSRQTTNRLLKLLETQGIVHLRFGEIEILDMEKLRSAAVAGSSRGA